MKFLSRDEKWFLWQMHFALSTIVYDFLFWVWSPWKARRAWIMAKWEKGTPFLSRVYRFWAVLMARTKQFLPTIGLYSIESEIPTGLCWTNLYKNGTNWHVTLNNLWMFVRIFTKYSPTGWKLFPSWFRVSFSHIGSDWYWESLTLR